VKALIRRELRSQSGFTLVELIIASAIGLIVMSALFSVVLTTTKAGAIATGRIEASGQIRNFQFEADDDFALANMPIPSGCAGTVGSPCTTQSIVLDGPHIGNPSGPPSPSPYHVTYTWDGSNLLLRQIGGNAPREAAFGVKSFTWYIDGTAPNQTVVVVISVTVQSYTETQTLRFFPHVNP
jgi:prepilin-type N-terminal cleavage/methylation domain-containing protein